MIDFLFLKFTFEQLFIISIGIIIFVIVFNLVFWPVRIFWKRKNGNKKNTVQFASQTSLLRFKIEHIKNPVERKLIKKILSVKFIVIFLSVIFLGIALYGLNLMFNSQPILTNYKPGDNAIWDNPRDPIEIEFDRPINPDKVKFSIVPEINGEIKFEKSFNNLPFTRKLYFYPSQSLDPGNRIYLYVNNFFSLFGNNERYGLESYIYSFNPPVIKETSIQEGAVEVPINSNFIYTLDKDLGDFAEFEFAFEPPVEFDKKVEGNKIIIQPKTTFPQSAKYKITASRIIKKIDLAKNEVIDKTAPEVVSQINFTTVTAPNIKSFSPTGSSVFANAEIKIVFNQQMLPETVIPRLTVTPAFDYTPVWSENNTTLVLQRAGKLDFSKQYTIKIAAGANGVANTTLENDFSYNFTTIGAVKVASISPSNNSYGNGLLTPIRIAFDQEVDKASAQSKFSVNPSFPGNFSWEGNTMIYRPSGNLNYFTRYTFTIASGVKSINGQDSQGSFTYSFVTLTQTVTLNVPLYSQQYNYSCNITAATMILAYKGQNFSQSGVFNDPAFPKQNVPRSGNTWGDPDIGFVGDLNGPDGYGVHWGPISNYLSGKGVSNRVQRGMNVVQLAKELEQGRPSIVWVWNGINGSPISWQTPGGRTINGVVGMHSWVVIGYIGTSDNPTSIIVNDPWGSRRTLSVSAFNSRWGYYGNTAIIVN